MYRALRDLERAGSADVVRDELGERRYRYRPEAEHRHYLVCRLCLRGRPLDAEVVERWVTDVARSTGFAEVRHTIELTGVCAECRGAGTTGDAAAAAAPVRAGSPRDDRPRAHG